jgi:hypothetical protein
VERKKGSRKGGGGFQRRHGRRRTGSAPATSQQPPLLFPEKRWRRAAEHWLAASRRAPRSAISRVAFYGFYPMNRPAIQSKSLSPLQALADRGWPFFSGGSVRSNSNRIFRPAGEPPPPVRRARHWRPPRTSDVSPHDVKEGRKETSACGGRSGRVRARDVAASFALLRSKAPTESLIISESA